MQLRYPTRVPGASENLPCLRYGDIVQLRLVAGVTTRGMHNVEVHARVINKQEENVTLLLPFAKHVQCQVWRDLIERKLKPLRTMGDDGEVVVTAPARVHARFQLNRSGFLLMHMALRIMLEGEEVSHA